MINADTEFKEAAKAPVRIMRASVRTEDDVAFTSSDTLKTLTIEATGFYFGVATKSLSFQLLGTSFNLLNQNVRVRMELQTNENPETWHACDLGYFTIIEQTIDLDKNITTLKAYDAIGIMGKTKYDGGLTFGSSIGSLVEEIATKFGLAHESEEVPNLDYIVVNDQYEKVNGITYRDILSEIAGATGAVAIVSGSNNKLQLRPINKVPLETLTYDNLRKIKLNGKYGAVNSIVLARTPQEDNIVATNDESIAENGLTEIKLANNSIMDDDRQLFAPTLLTVADGFSFYPFEATTEGHGWYEVCDLLNATDGTNNWPILITSISLTLGGGIKEVLKGIAPTETQTNYALAGGITKTLYNTEIKVDKQSQIIESVVEEQTILENQVNENYTAITQSISNVITSVQSSGGNNLLKNSAMYSLDSDGLPVAWALSGSGTINIAPSAEAAVNGSLSRQNISLKGITVTQIIEVKADNSDITDKTYYSFSCKIRKTAIGECLVRITDGTEIGVWEIGLANGEESFYNEYSLEGILPKSSSLIISIYGSSDSEFSINDMMLAVGDYKTQWTQANGEFANTQVSIDNNGVIIRSNTLTGTYTKQTPQELSAYSNNTLSATINNDGIRAPKAEFKNEINMSPIKIVPQSDGWAFVRSNN